ncbi:hypothetical protein K435DRAFT_781386 [Dendrothele bispora CBS 962.96]|uniref:RING-14 protein n=1 Tax=Dendrothele bispora (strain CBS 962.96) TaxID=1314807 RepID=A0A4S8LL98_DENBC|nr:hypothetical protein K435DRAFT_781386 [Dendrothele bispora CBS 962.96]
MHFSKTYAKLLQDLPPDLRQNAIQYRQLKKLINQVVLELSSLGLSPQVLQELLDGQESNRTHGFRTEAEVHDDSNPVASTSHSTLDDEYGSWNSAPHPKVVYEFNSKSGKIEPRLRIWVTRPLPDVELPSEPPSRMDSDSEDVEDEDGIHSREEDGGERSNTEESSKPEDSFLWALQQRARSLQETDRIVEVTEQSPVLASPDSLPPNPSQTEPDGPYEELVIPLVKDSAFFQLLSTALQGLSDHFLTLHTGFTDTLQSLAKTIGNSARPVSSTTTFHPHSVLSHPGEITAPIRTNKSDLYSWREIFQLYIDAEVFQSFAESHPGQQSTEESERRLQLFAARVSERGLGDRRKLKMKQSRDALETFLGLNMLILNIKKFQEANAEATRKILKKHAKRTALPLPPSNNSSPGPLALSLSSSHTPSSSTYPPPPLDPGITIIGTSVHSFLPRILVQAIGETLLPIIPHIDDYSCVICTSIAFKPIRLGCGHLFCVRCLVKMQKRGQDACPMCRAPNVLRADKSNVDWALLNFMQDWFPVEARKKQKQSEKEAAEEHLVEMGFDPSQKCVIM